MSNIQAYKRRGIVSVVGSWKTEHASIAESLGRRIALEGLSLMTGGGQGVMKAAARGFCSVPRGERKGVSIGVLWSGVKVGEIPDYPNEFIEVPISMKVGKGEGTCVVVLLCCCSLALALLLAHLAAWRLARLAHRAIHSAAAAQSRLTRR